MSSDDVVGFSDLSIIPSNWPTSDGGDLNGDGKTNSFDLSLVLFRLGHRMLNIWRYESLEH